MKHYIRTAPCAVLGLAGVLAAFNTSAVPVAGGTLDPTTIPKYVTPLVIPPVMNNDGSAHSYDIAVREFRQQILPGGIWNSVSAACMADKKLCKFNSTRVWSYGPASDPLPAMGVAPAANSQFNYPAYTIEAMTHTPVNVRWINDLVDKEGNYLDHLLPIDQTVHWANPPMDCRTGEPRTDCAGRSQEAYKGPVPIVTHVHGAHVGPESDGYPEAWWLPAANNIPDGWASSGTLFDDAGDGPNDGTLGYADFSYPNSQPAATLWYHDHTLGMTRNNVYAGPAGFWLIRGANGEVGDDSVETNDPGEWDGRLPGPAPVAGQGVLDLNVPGNPARNAIREIPIVIQDRSFNNDGSLFYPQFRAFFEGVDKGKLKIPFVGDPNGAPSDVLPIWQPEAFFNVMVVNGVSWPELEVAPALYRLRLLNGCNSRFLWLKFSNADVEVHQIGAEQGFLPAPVDMNNGSNAEILMGLAERADVIVDFRGLADGTEIELLNIAPDEPFGGGIPGEDFDPADPSTSGKVMRFKLNHALLGASPTDPEDANGVTNPNAATEPAFLVLNAEAPLGDADATRAVSLNEAESELVCVSGDMIKGTIRYAGPPDAISGVCPMGSEPFGPIEALLGTVDLTDPANPVGNPLKWTDASDPDSKAINIILNNGTNVVVNVTENPALGDTEEWDIYNFTADAHPIHLHLVRFEVLKREVIGGGVSVAGSNEPLPWETGYKDTVISYPGEITTLKARFDMEGLYVWHCHIVEHEDNEMMRPYYVGSGDFDPTP
jgi:FtsP/CotA-like multicopper oxidase with cupredoxin domain